MKPKIIQLIADSGFGGGPKHVFDLVSGLKKDKFEIRVICPSGELVGKLKEIKIPVTEVEMYSGVDKNAISRISKIFQENVSDKRSLIIHCHGVRAGSIGRIAYQLIKQPGKLIKLVYTEHLWTKDYHLKDSVREWLQIQGLKKLDNLTDKTIAVSNAVKEFFLSKKITSPEKIEVIYNGIEPKSKIINLKSKINTIGSVGTLNFQKDFESLILAMKEVIKDYPDIELEIIGSGEEEKKLKSLALSSFGFNNNPVHFLGGLSQEEIEKKILDWDIYAQSSLSESFGLAIVMAMRVGLPIVATGVGGVPELVTHQENGLLVEKKNPKMLADAIKYLISDFDLRKKISENNVRKIKEQFSLDKMVKETEKLYEKIT